MAMKDSFQSVGSTLAQLVLAVSAVVAVAQYVQSVEQNKTNAALSFISIHNNERFYDARQEIMKAYSSLVLKPDAEIAALPDDMRKELLADLAKAQLRSQTDTKIGADQLDLLALSLIHLYDSAAKCVDQGVCRQDITDYHFRNFIDLLLIAYARKIPEWQQQFKGLSVDARKLLNNEIEGNNMLRRACLSVGFCS